MCTQVHLEPKRPRISTYLGESFQLICWIFSEVFWLSEYRILARLTKKWPGSSSGSCLLQLICLGSGGQHVQRPPPRGMGRPIGLQCPCNSFTRQEVRGASDSTNQRIENNALVSSSGIAGGARRVVCLVVSCSPVRFPLLAGVRPQ